MTGNPITPAGFAGAEAPGITKTLTAGPYKSRHRKMWAPTRRARSGPPPTRPGLTDWPSGGVIGFPGTNQPGLIPGPPSHGCIRVRNHDIARFYRLVPVGTPLRIR